MNSEGTHIAHEEKRSEREQKQGDVRGGGGDVGRALEEEGERGHMSCPYVRNHHERIAAIRIAGQNGKP